MHIELLLTNIGFGISTVVSISLAILVLVKKPRKNAGANVLYFLTAISIAVWQASYVIGINIHDSELSRLVFMFNLSALFAVLFQTHLALVLTDRIKSQTKVMAFFYLVGAGFFVYFLVYPLDFMLPSEPKMYFPNFFNLGPGYGVQDTYFFFLLVYMLYQLYVGYSHADIRKRFRLKFFVIATVYGYVISLISEFLMYDIPVDPLISSLTGLYTLPMAYAILKYDTINITVIAKRSFGYALVVFFGTFLFLLISDLNDIIRSVLPGFPDWFLPFVSSVIAAAAGFYIWRKIKEVDNIKYQFIDVMTHKFRHPLTYIKWSTETIRNSHNSHEKELALESIETANAQLMELTRTLTDMSGSDEKSAQIYSLEAGNANLLLRDAISSTAMHAKEKYITIKNEIPSNAPQILIDKTKCTFVIQALLENAITYSEAGSSIEIRFNRTKEHGIISIRDHGIGISSDDIPFIFSKFYRSVDATHVHTEGMGISLYLAKGIMKRHGGDLYAESDGPGKGATFFLKIPLAKDLS